MDANLVLIIISPWWSLAFLRSFAHSFLSRATFFQFLTSSILISWSTPSSQRIFGLPTLLTPSSSVLNIFVYSSIVVHTYHVSSPCQSFSLDVTDDVWIFKYFIQFIIMSFSPYFVLLFRPENTSKHLSFKQTLPPLTSFRYSQCFRSICKYRSNKCFTHQYFSVFWGQVRPQKLSVEITNKMQPCNRIYYSTVHWRLNIFRAA